MAPERIGDFQVVRILGKGGMGAVYEGVHSETGERVAIKVLLDKVGDDVELRQRFASEINTLKHLRHPNIVRLHGFGTDGGNPYYVMELIDGPSLGNELKWRRRFEWIEAAKIGLDLCLALKYACDRGIIHRDIKPANVMLDRVSGAIKLSDFGIAHFFGADQISDLHSIIGTLEYMAPEQALGRMVGHKADLYAVGVVLYALLAGHPPHTARTINEIRQKHKDEVVAPIKTLRHDVPDDITFLIDELLQYDPQQRPINVAMVVRRFQATLRGLFGDPSTILLTPSDPAMAKMPHEAVTSDSLGQTMPQPAIAPSVPNRLGDSISMAARPDANALGGTPDTLHAHRATRTAPPAAQVAPHTPPPEFPTVSEPGATYDIQSDFEFDNKVRREVEGVRPAVRESESAVKSVVSSAASTSTSASHFVVVREDELGHYETPAPRVIRPFFVIKTVLLVVCLTAIVLTVISIVRPLPADELLQRIYRTIATATASSGGSDSDVDRLAVLRLAEPDIRAFLRRFPDNPSASMMASYLDEMQGDERLRRWETRLLKLDPQQRLPIEQSYLEARSLQESDPERAVARFRAIEDLYRPQVVAALDSESETPRPTASSLLGGAVSRSLRSGLHHSRQEQVVAMATFQRERWEHSWKTIRETTLQMLEQRLATANELSASQPEEAAAIRRAIVELYESKPWAVEVVERARERPAPPQ